MKSEVFLMDCMEGMKQYPDKYFDLAVVDPPYGLGMRTVEGGTKRNSQTKFIDDLKSKQWDNEIPKAEYWEELFRVSKNQIVWGGNYFGLPAHRTFIVWDKMTYVPTMSQVELAWTSFDSPARMVKINSNQLDRSHPTQKPVALYDWIYKNYLPNGGKVLDTHGGSMSNLIAALKAGNIEMHVYEIDKDYFKDAKQRVELFQSQGNLFAESQKIEWISF